MIVINGVEVTNPTREYLPNETRYQRKCRLRSAGLTVEQWREKLEQEYLNSNRVCLSPMAYSTLALS